FDRQLAVASGNLEGKHVLPFGPRRMQPGHLALRAAQRQETIVVDRNIPKIGRRSRKGERQLAEKPSRQIDEVRSLIDKLAAAGTLRLPAPLLVITPPSAMAVAAANEEDGPQLSFGGKLVRPVNGGVKTMVESNLDHPVARSRRLSKRPHFAHVASGRLLDENMPSRLPSPAGHPRKA